MLLSKFVQVDRQESTARAAVAELNRAPKSLVIELGANDGGSTPDPEP